MPVKQQWCGVTYTHNPLLIAQNRSAIYIRETKLITIVVLLFCIHCSPAFAVDQWEKNTFYCNAADGYRFPSKGKVQNSTGAFPDDCDDGDMTLFNGLLCASGNPRGCDSVKKAMSQPDVNPAHAKFWRSPRRAQNNNLHMEGAQTFTNEYGSDKSFSPDMELGVLLYAITTRDADSLAKWFTWISDTRSCILTKPVFDYPCFGTKEHPFRMCRTGGGCLLYNIPRYCEDQKCTMFPLDRDMDDAVYSAIVGQSPPDGIGNYNSKVSAILNAASLITVGLGVPVALLGSTYLNTPVGDKIYNDAIVGRAGFPRHKNAIRAWILTKINHVDQQRARDALSVMAKQEPNNPFFNYLNEGSTAHVSNLVKEYCPTAQNAADTIKITWTWETGPSAQWSPASTQKDSMLWECIFMRNLLGTAGIALGNDNNEAVRVIISSLLTDPEESTIRLTSSASSVMTGRSITLTATVQGDSPTGTVQFKDNGINLGTPVPLANKVAKLTTSALKSLGIHTLTAAYAGNTNNRPSVSPAVAISVTPVVAPVAKADLYLYNPGKVRTVPALGLLGNDTGTKPLTSSVLVTGTTAAQGTVTVNGNGCYLPNPASG